MVWREWPPASLHIHPSPSLCQSWVRSYWSWYNTEGLLAKPHFEDKLAGIWTPATLLGEHSGQGMSSFGHTASLIPLSPCPLLWGVVVSAEHIPQNVSFPPLIRRGWKRLGGPFTEPLTCCASGPAWLSHSWRYTTARSENTRQAKSATRSTLRTLLDAFYYLSAKWRVHFTLGKSNVPSWRGRSV